MEEENKEDNSSALITLVVSIVSISILVWAFF